ncbi:MAG: hypothetical protein HOV81_09615 [Kofleriaceae bacterium]|nr:hypothetical protein [Kofleriaceae bacterium]
MRIALASLVVAGLGGGCAMQTSPDDPGDIGGEEGSGSGSGSGLIASGTYKVRSQIDLTAELLLPTPAADMVETLRDFSTDPARTLFDLADDAGVPAVGTIRDALPSVVEDRLYGWIDGEIANLTINGVPVTQVAGGIASLAETAFSQFAIDSELAIDGGASTHTLTAIDLSPTGIDRRYALASIPDVITTATPTCSTADGSLSIGDHTYGLPYGEIVWQAVNDEMIADHGLDIRGALGAAINCPALAQRVASKCIYSYCVGHAAELTSICERGLDEVVERAHAKVAEMRIDALHLAAGTATLGDANHDGLTETLDGGVWTAELDAGLGLRHVPATFTGTVLR